MDSFSKANEAFVAENYEDAVELYTKAIDEDNSKDDFYCNRAQAYIKIEKYEEAIKDAEKAIELNSKNFKAHLRKGIASFYLGDYENSKSVLQEGAMLEGSSSDKSFSTWIRKCEAEIDLTKNRVMGEDIEVGVSGKNQLSKLMDEANAGSTQKTTEVTKQSPTAKPAEIPMPVGPKTRYDWYQTETQVVITILLKNTKNEDVNIDIQERSLSASVKLPTGNDYTLELDLAHAIVPEKSITKILTSKIEIKLKKQEGIRWNKLEGDYKEEEKKIKHFNPDSTTDKAAKKYPSSAHYTRDWDKIVTEIKQEEKDEKLEGDAALNQLFQQIYADGSDEVRKAMNKSFSESGGTVLSTNWTEVGTNKVDCKPPDGMEYKKYED